MKLCVIGGGAAGFFGAIRAAELLKDNTSNIKSSVQILEATPNFLKKVRISGGGRCNVTHNLFDTNKLCENYPRGERELKSPFTQFQASDTVEWFKNKGIRLVAESDGRMFPVSNSSETIINCFLKEASRLNIDYKSGLNVQSIEKAPEGDFLIGVRNKAERIRCDKILVATGSSPVGYRLAKSLGHSITDLAPSLFSFKLEDPLLHGLAGTSFKTAAVHIKVENVKKNFVQKGSILVTHWGLSGPAILKISAWAARELKKNNYQGKLVVNWLGAKSAEVVFEKLKTLKACNQNALVKNYRPNEITKSFWEGLLSRLDVDFSKKWSGLSHQELRKIAEHLVNYEFDIKGKNRFKDEFVECGGVNLKEINFKTMESKICKGLYFAGEILDIDGITGGFNFQNAWTTSWLAAGAIFESKRIYRLK